MLDAGVEFQLKTRVAGRFRDQQLEQLGLRQHQDVGEARLQATELSEDRLVGASSHHEALDPRVG